MLLWVIVFWPRGGGVKVLSGITAPSADLGKDGNIYKQINPIPLARYVKFTITKIRGGNNTTYQFTGPFFINNANGKYGFPSGTSYTSSGLTFSSGESPANAWNTGVNGKACGTITYPGVITYDLKSAVLNTEIYNRVQIYTSNDTAGYSSRNIQDFKIELSLDGVEWITICDVVDCPNKAANYSVLYTSDEFLKTKLWLKENGVWN